MIRYRLILLLLVALVALSILGCGMFSLTACTDEEAAACLADPAMCDPCFLGSPPANGSAWSLVDP